METKNMYLKRLLSLARHLGEDRLNELLFKKENKYYSDKADCNIEHYHWALAQLPKVAPKYWKYNEEGHPYLLSHPGLNSLTAAGLYFDLSADELFHLFVPGYQQLVYMLKPLGDNATPSDITSNIYQFLYEKEAALVCLTYKKRKDKKVIKKYKYHKAA